jgi:hypothetical protein
VTRATLRLQPAIPVTAFWRLACFACCAVCFGPWSVVVLGSLLLLPGLGSYAVAVGMFTFLFTDIEGSTALLQRVGENVYAQVLADHHGLIRAALAGHGGRRWIPPGTGSSRCSRAAAVDVTG